MNALKVFVLSFLVVSAAGSRIHTVRERVDDIVRDTVARASEALRDAMSLASEAAADTREIVFSNMCYKDVVIQVSRADRGYNETVIRSGKNVIFDSVEFIHGHTVDNSMVWGSNSPCVSIDGNQICNWIRTVARGSFTFNFKC